MTATINQRDRFIGVAFVAAAVVIQIAIMGIAIMALNVGLLIALGFWLTGGWQQSERKRTALWFAIGLACFIAHFAEEWSAGLDHELPGLLGYQWPEALFVAFNASWFALFVAAVFAVWFQLRLGYLVLLFFAIGGGVLNGVGHVLIAIVLGRYFPGLYTAPLMLAVGIQLLRIVYPPRVARGA